MHLQPAKGALKHKRHELRPPKEITLLLCFIFMFVLCRQTAPSHHPVRDQCLALYAGRHATQLF